MLTFLNLLTCAWGQKTLWKNPAPLGCLFCSYKQQRGEDGTGTALFWGVSDGRGEQRDKQSPFQKRLLASQPGSLPLPTFP